MVWGGISMRGTTNLSVIAGTVDSRVYQNILNENIPTMSALYPDGYILQQDNARPHTSRTTIEFFKKYRLVVLKWPAGSPDLNPIENLWAIMKRKLERAQKRTISEWKAEIEKIWSDIRPDVIKSFIESMPRRIQMVIEADGKIIKY
jgi:2-polyprenyl-6-methoxyphenol hydroxylase-like FAD-dependent oxidoreductase